MKKIKRNEWLDWELINLNQWFFFEVWKIVPRLLDGGIEEVPSQSFTVHTASLCGMQCQLRQSCQLFRFNILTTECDLYDGIAFRKISNVTGNRFFQKMPSSKSVSACTANVVLLSTSICLQRFKMIMWWRW